MKQLITAAFANLLPDGVPKEIVYLPEGESIIHPKVDGVPKEITVNVPAAKGTQIAATLQAALAERQKSNVRPWFDFEHKAGASSALPQSFRYEPGKGIMCALEWTGAGRTAIEGKDFSYFSPAFLIDDDGTPSGLPERGPLGALVNEPAFREIPRIAASDANPTIEPPPVMSKLIFAALAISAAHADAETLAVQAIEKLKVEAGDNKAKITALEASIADLTAQRDKLKSEGDKMKADCAAADAKRLAGLVEGAVAAGKIAPKDEDTKKEVLIFLEANEAMGVKYIGAMPVKFAAFEKPIITAGASAPAAASGFEAKAKALVTAGDAKTIDDAFGIVAASDPAAYADYLKSIAQ